MLYSFINHLIIKPLAKLDTYLLQRYPIIWETKIHYVLFYSAIVANLGLIGLGHLYPARELSYIPYNELIENVWTWVFCLALLSILGYAYQQSYVRIKIYSFKQSLLRYGLYMLGVSSILFNTLVLPNTLVYRVNQLNDYQTLKQDFISHLKTEYLIEITQFVDFMGDSAVKNRKDYLTILQKTPINQEKTVERTLAFLEEIKQLSAQENKESRLKYIRNHPH
jgi:hypothetical protein